LDLPDLVTGAGNIGRFSLGRFG